MPKKALISILMIIGLLITGFRVIPQEIDPISIPDSLFLIIRTGMVKNRSIALSNNGNVVKYFSVTGDFQIGGEEKNNALDFDGLDDYVDCGILGLGDSVREVTVEFWMKPYNIDDDLGGWEFFGQTFAEFRFGIFAGAYSILANREQEGEWIYYRAAPAKKWTHIAVSYDGDFIRIYENGKFLGRNSHKGYLNLDRLFYIGTKDQKDDYADGIIDEVRVWNTVRTESEIIMDMNRELTGQEKGLVGYWPFNEFKGEIASDHTRKGHEGRLMNGPVWLVSTAPVIPLQWWKMHSETDSILPGQEAILDLEFFATHLDDGIYKTEIQIVNEDHDTVFKIPVAMQVIGAPAIAILLDSMAFNNNIYYGQDYVMELMILNHGYYPLEISKILSDNSAFVPDTAMLSIAPRSWQKINITYHPGLIRNGDANLTICSNDPDNPEYVINISSEKVTVKKAYIIQWILYFILFLAVVFLFLLYLNYRIRISLYRKLEVKVSEELEKQEQQRQIIAHQSRLTSLGEMAAGIAHEINVPLQYILFNAESIEKEQNKINPDKEKVELMLHDIKQDIQKINSLVDHVKTFSGDRESKSKKEFYVNEIIQGIIALNRVKMARQKIKFTLDLDNQLPCLQGDPNKLEQVLINLLSNARDAVNDKADLTRNGYVKEIRIKTRVIIQERGSASLDVPLREEKDAILIDFEDNGTGIPEEHISKIFNPFFTTKKIGKGTGLGLSISYGLIRDMNGTINVYSKEKKGTTFKLILPL